MNENDGIDQMLDRNVEFPDRNVEFPDRNVEFPDRNDGNYGRAVFVAY